MKINYQNLTLLILSVGLTFTSCQNSDREQKLGEKEKQLLIKENELLKKELANADSVRVASNKETQNFLVSKALVKKAFLNYLPDVSDGRKLNEYWQTSDGKGFKIVIGDINGDNLLDALVDYSLEPTLEDNGGGGNAIGELPGLVAFVNTGNSNNETYLCN